MKARRKILIMWHGQCFESFYPWRQGQQNDILMKAVVFAIEVSMSNFVLDIHHNLQPDCEEGWSHVDIAMTIATSPEMKY